MRSAEPGRIIAGRYRLSAVIGRGGMGVVWQARDELLSRDVAVKELTLSQYPAEAEQRATCHRAIREARVAARVNHRNVVQVFDIVEEDGCPWIVMELLPCWSLRDQIKKEGRLCPARAAELGLELLAALRAAHTAGVVHRDVKPANVLLAPDRVVLTDFGIARTEAAPARTNAGKKLIGSPSYIAPERAMGGRSGPAEDLWGLGALLYAAVEGRAPFDRDGSALATLTAVVADEPEPASHAGPLWPVISGLLRKDPNERLQAGEADQMLRGVCGATSVPVGPGLPPPRRSRRPAAAVAGSVVLAVIATSGAAMGLTRTGSPAQEPAAASGITQPSSAGGDAPSAGTRTPASKRSPAASSRTPGAHTHPMRSSTESTGVLDARSDRIAVHQPHNQLRPHPPHGGGHGNG